MQNAHRKIQFDQFLFGGDYNPDQWGEETWLEDVRLMKQAGVNTATVGTFMWASLEPEEGRFEFDWLDRAMDLLADNNIRVILSTPIAALPGNDQRTVSPQIAIVWESDAWWATETRGLPSSLLEFFPSLREVHKALWYQGFTTDFAQLGGDLSQYDLVLIPSCIPVSDEQAANLESYVRAGGHAAAWFFTGSTDQYLRVRAGRTFNAAVAPTLGVRVEEHWPLAPEEPVALSNGMSGALWSETIHLEGAESLVEYREGPLDGLPAITRHRLGEGTATYISTSIEGEELQTFLASLATEAGIAKDHPDSGNGLEIVTRPAGTERYAFVLNHSSRARTVTISGTDTISGQKLGPTLNMAPKTWRVITL